jgi:arsenical pump membrane protein
LFAALIGVMTLVGIMTRPFRWNEAVMAMAGACVLLILGLITPADAFFTLARDWNTFLFFLGDDGAFRSSRGGGSV